MITPTPPPPPPPILNTTEPPPPPPPTPQALGGFTPTCSGQDDQDVSVEECEQEDIRYVYFLRITKDVQLDEVKETIDDSLIRHMWIDKQTTQVEIRFVTYNGNLELFAVTAITFEFNLGACITCAS
jgi:hypothetical protein